jgi:hypothetical protein
VVGFDEPPYTTYLVFKKPLTEFLDARIVGIDYDVLSDAPVVTSKGVRLPKAPKTHAAKVQRAPAKPAPAPLVPKRAPEPKEFRVCACGSRG